MSTRSSLKDEQQKILLSSVDWKSVWMIPSAGAGIIMILFVLIFKDGTKDQAICEGDVAQAAAREENP